MKVKIPAGTTQEQWDQYHEDLQRHEKFIARYTFFLDRICKHLEFINGNGQPQAAWTPDEIRRIIANEIKQSDSMDAPNKPGYEFANND